MTDDRESQNMNSISYFHSSNSCLTLHYYITLYIARLHEQRLTYPPYHNEVPSHGVTQTLPR